MSAPTAVSAIILAPPAVLDRVIVHVSLSERARRSARHAGIAPERIHIVRDAADLARARQHIEGPFVVIRAFDQVVMPALVKALAPDRPGTRVAVDAAGRHVGALRLEPGQPDVEATVTVGNDAFHPARTDAEARAATAWLWQFIHKPELDTLFTRYLCRPLARPLTHLFLRLPFSPNQITVFSILLGWLGCLLAAGAGYGIHVAGLALVVFGNGLLDAVDGEVARLRLQYSKAGDWLDAFGDHTLRFALIVALGSHVAPRFPDLPIWPVALATAAATLVAMVPMYWYCLSVHRTINLQHYNDVVRGNEAPSPLGRLGIQLSSRDFSDYAFLVLAVVGLSIVSLAGTAAGALVALATVARAHPRAVRQRRAARTPALA